MKKLIALLLALVMVFALGACAKDEPAPAPETDTPETDTPETDTPETDAPETETPDLHYNHHKRNLPPIYIHPMNLKFL